MAKLLKVAGKSNRKPRKYAKKVEVLENKFENSLSRFFVNRTFDADI